MKQYFLKLQFFLILVAFSSNSFGQVNWTKLTAELLNAYNNASSNNESLKAAQKLVEDIQSGKNPSVPGNKWKDLADSYKAVAKIIEQAPLPTDFDSKPYTFSISELTNCGTREASLSKINGYLIALQDAKKNGDQSIVILDKNISDVDITFRALTYLIDWHTKVPTPLPPYNDIFIWDWLELTTDVQPALANIKSALQTQRNKIQNNLILLNQSIPNLSSNLTLLMKLSCSLAGVWKGNSTGGNVTVPMQLLIELTAGIWSGKINVNDEGDDFRNISVSGSSITFVVGPANTPFTYTGSVSPDGMKLNGTFTSSVANGTFSLIRN